MSTQKECRAAIVTAPTSDYEISLCVLNPTGLFFNQGVEHDPGTEQPIERPNGEIVHINTYRGGTWHWPERED